MRKSVTIRLILLFSIVIFSFSLYRSLAIAEDQEIRKITPKENSLEKILFIKNNFDKNKVYTSIEDENAFRNILIGVWDARPHGMIEFKSDGRFEAQRLDDKDIKNLSGFWKFGDGTLKISHDKKNWKNYKVKEYRLSFHELRRNRGTVYGFSIGFDNMIWEMSEYITIDFYTK